MGLRISPRPPIERSVGELDLAALVRPGDTVIWGQGTAEPSTLTEALVAQRHDIVRPGDERVNIFLSVTRGTTLNADQQDTFRFFGLGGLGETARLTKVGAVEVMPTRLGSVARLIREGRLTIDVVLVQLSEPRDGVCTTGVVGDVLQEAIRSARVVIGEINPRVPRTVGDVAVALEDLDVIVRSDRPLVAWPSAPPGDTARQIAGHIVDRMPDGATVQLGIGAIPDAVVGELAGRRDLGIHTGMITDSMVALLESGAVTNARKPIDTGVTVTGLAFGTELINRYVDDNPAVQLRSLDHTHNRTILAEFDDLWAINSAIEVDLTGQVNAEVMGGRYVGGVGGQLDFVEAAIASARGRSVIAFPATAARGTTSRIVSHLTDGIVTTPRGSADLFVTEYGVADLRGASISQRITAMIAIAHPDHREQLRTQARLL